VWEPVLPTDWGAPSTSALKRIDGPPTFQFWDKERLLSHRMGEHDKDSIVFVGDSPNDAPMFGFFPNSVGVANVLDFAGELPASPAFVTSGRGAQGFAELADALIAAKGMEVPWIKAD